MTTAYKIEQNLFSEGRIVNNEGDFAFEYHLRDHLGSTRVAFTPSFGGGQGEVEVVQINNYYPFGAPIADLSWSASDNKYFREGKEYIDGFDWNKYDFHARTFDPWNPVSLQIDPHAESYYNISPYALWGNNPIRNVDPTGLTHYSINSKGEIIVMTDEDGNTLGEDDEFDMLFSGDNSIRVDDRSILSQLAATGKNSDYEKSFAKGNPSGLASVFLFAADNSDVEWRFSRYDVGNGNQYAIGTVHDLGNGFTQRAINPEEMGFSRESEIAFIHSHPGTYKTKDDVYYTMGWRILSDVECDFFNRPRGTAGLKGDSYNVANYTGSSYENYYTYFPSSGDIYRVRGAEVPEYIRNIANHKNNPKKLFWGTLNGR